MEEMEDTDVMAPGRARRTRGGPRGRGPRWRSRRSGQAGLGLIEVLIALTIFAVGMLAVAGIGLSVGAQTNWAVWQTDQSLAAQQVLERVQREGYDAASSGTETVTVGNRTYTASRTVTQVDTRVKEVSVTVSTTREWDRGVPPRTFVTRLYEPRPLPSP